MTQLCQYFIVLFYNYRATKNARSILRSIVLIYNYFSCMHILCAFDFNINTTLGFHSFLSFIVKTSKVDVEVYHLNKNYVHFFTASKQQP